MLLKYKCFWQQRKGIIQIKLEEFDIESVLELYIWKYSPQRWHLKFCVKYFIYLVNKKHGKYQCGRNCSRFLRNVKTWEWGNISWLWFQFCKKESVLKRNGVDGYTTWVCLLPLSSILKHDSDIVFCCVTVETRPCYVPQAGFTLMHEHALASQVLGLKMSATILGHNSMSFVYCCIKIGNKINNNRSQVVISAMRGIMSSRLSPITQWDGV